MGEREREQETDPGIPLPALSRLCRRPKACTQHRLTPAQLLLFGEKEPSHQFSLLAGHRRTTPASEGVIFFLSICMLQNLETFL